MSSEIKRNTRIELLDMIKELFRENNEGLRTSDIANTMGVSEDTVLRDLSFLSSFGKLPLVKEGRYWKVVEKATDKTDRESNASPNPIKQYPYDVALSFAGEDRTHAEALAGALRHHGIRVFYDKYEKDTLWGKDLYTHLSDLYQNKARYCVTFFSHHYIEKTWTKHELRAAQARAFREQQEYILPIRLDETEIPGMLPTTAYLSWEQEGVESIVYAILKKLSNIPRKSVKELRKEGEELRRKGQYKQALVACEQAIRIDPYDSDNYHEYGWVLRKLKQHEQALNAFEQAIQFDDNDDTEWTLELYREKGQTLEDLERYQEALAVYEWIIQFSKERVGTSHYYHYNGYDDLCCKGSALLGLERYDEALIVYEQANQIALHSNSAFERKKTLALSNKGYTLYLLDRNDEALAICEKVIELEPDDSYAYELKGDILNELDRHEEALDFYGKAISRNPKNVYSTRRRSELLYQLGRYEEAQLSIEQAIQLDPSDQASYEIKRNILIALGRIDRRL